jgi:hypothetical protein
MKEIIKVGDIVEIKSWDEMVKEYGLTYTNIIRCCAGFTKEMKHLCGCKARINKIYDKIIELDWIDKCLPNSFTYSLDMVKKVKETSASKCQSTDKSDKTEVNNEVIIITNNGYTK